MTTNNQGSGIFNEHDPITFEELTTTELAVRSSEEFIAAAVELLSQKDIVDFLELDQTDLNLVGAVESIVVGRNEMSEDGPGRWVYSCELYDFSLSCESDSTGFGPSVLFEIRVKNQKDSSGDADSIVSIRSRSPWLVAKNADDPLSAFTYLEIEAKNHDNSFSRKHGLVFLPASLGSQNASKTLVYAIDPNLEPPTSLLYDMQEALDSGQTFEVTSTGGNEGAVSITSVGDIEASVVPGIFHVFHVKKTSGQNHGDTFDISEAETDGKILEMIRPLFDIGEGVLSEVVLKQPDEKLLNTDVVTGDDIESAQYIARKVIGSADLLTAGLAESRYRQGEYRTKGIVSSGLSFTTTVDGAGAGSFHTHLKYDVAAMSGGEVYLQSRSLHLRVKGARESDMAVVGLSLIRESNIGDASLVHHEGEVLFFRNYLVIPEGMFDSDEIAQEMRTLYQNTLLSSVGESDTDVDLLFRQLVSRTGDYRSIALKLSRGPIFESTLRYFREVTDETTGNTFHLYSLDEEY